MSRQLDGLAERPARPGPAALPRPAGRRRRRRLRHLGRPRRLRLGLRRRARRPTTSSPRARTGASRRCCPIAAAPQRPPRARGRAAPPPPGVRRAAARPRDGLPPPVLGARRHAAPATASTCGTRPTSCTRCSPIEAHRHEARDRRREPRHGAPPRSRDAMTATASSACTSLEFSQPDWAGAEPDAADRDQLAVDRHPRHADLRRLGARLRHRPAPRARPPRRRPGRRRARAAPPAGRQPARLPGGARLPASTAGRLPGDAPTSPIAPCSSGARPRSSATARPPRGARRRSTTSWLEPNPQNMPGTPASDRAELGAAQPAAPLDELPRRRRRRRRILRAPAGLPPRASHVRGGGGAPDEACRDPRRRPVALQRGHPQPPLRRPRRPPAAATAAGPRFAVWAPNAARGVASSATSTAGTRRAHPLDARRATPASGPASPPTSAEGHRYKFHIESAGRRLRASTRPTRSRVWAEQAPQHRLGAHGPRPTSGTTATGWPTRARATRHDAPMSIYEMHLGSWRHAADEHRSLNYRELAEPLADYLVAMGFTHVELLPDHGAPVLRLVGLPDAPGTSRRRRASARRRTSCTSSTTCTSGGSA